MKTYCKKVNIADLATITPWVQDCLAGKEKRKDFSRLLLKYGDAEGIAREIIKRIEARNLNLRPIQITERVDGMCGKVRQLGIEEPLQQCMDYVAVHALEPLFKAKIGRYQCASIKGRGQIYGKKTLERWVNGDPKYTKLYVKADVYHCYASIQHDAVERHLSRDVKNPLLIWFTMALVKTHPNGLSIGSYLSQHLCNYLLSYAYHYTTECLAKYRRGKRIRLCYHVLFYMDDIFMSGNDKRNLRMAARMLDKYLQSDLGVHLKPTFCVKDVEAEPIDMMGYVVHKGYTTIRARIFIRARRALIRAGELAEKGLHISLREARRIMSYRGFFLHSNSMNARIKYGVGLITRAAAQTIRFYTKKANEEVYFYVSNRCALRT